MTLPIQQYDQNKIRLICVHEAGHYIAGRELLFKTHGIKILFKSRQQGHSASAVIEPWTSDINSLDKLRNYLERRIQVLFAGAIAEATDVKGNYNSNYALKEWSTGGGASNDHAKIRELVQTLRNINYPETVDEPNAQKELNFIDQALIEKAGAIILTRRELIFGVADMLFQKVKSYDVQYELTENEINTIPNIRKLFIDKESPNNNFTETKNEN